jgi:hypothetical protein
LVPAPIVAPVMTESTVFETAMPIA